MRDVPIRCASVWTGWRASARSRTVAAGVAAYARDRVVRGACAARTRRACTRCCFAISAAAGERGWFVAAHRQADGTLRRAEVDVERDEMAGRWLLAATSIRGSSYSDSNDRSDISASSASGAMTRSRTRSRGRAGNSMFVRSTTRTMAPGYSPLKALHRPGCQRRRRGGQHAHRHRRRPGPPHAGGTHLRCPHAPKVGYPGDRFAAASSSESTSEMGRKQ